MDGDIPDGMSIRRRGLGQKEKTAAGDGWKLLT